MLLVHPAVTGMRYPPMWELAGLLCESLDIAAFDQRGHGSSGGACSADPLRCALDLRAVAKRFRSLGYGWVGTVGFSLGGMAALVAAARWGELDAVASVSAPPRLPDLRQARRHPHLYRLLLLGLGARFERVETPVVTPLEAVPHIAPVPLLLVHGKRDFTYPGRDFELLWEAAGEPKERLVLPEAGHAELAGGREAVAEWVLRAAAQ